MTYYGEPSKFDRICKSRKVETRGILPLKKDTGDIEFWWKDLAPKNFTSLYFGNKANETLSFYLSCLFTNNYLRPMFPYIST